MDYELGIVRYMLRIFSLMSSKLDFGSFPTCVLPGHFFNKIYIYQIYSAIVIKSPGFNSLTSLATNLSNIIHAAPTKKTPPQMVSNEKPNTCIFASTPPNRLSYAPDSPAINNTANKARSRCFSQYL